MLSFPVALTLHVSSRSTEPYTVGISFTQPEYSHLLVASLLKVSSISRSVVPSAAIPAVPLRASSPTNLFCPRYPQSLQGVQLLLARSHTLVVCLNMFANVLLSKRVRLPSWMESTLNPKNLSLSLCSLSDHASSAYRFPFWAQNVTNCQWLFDKETRYVPKKVIDSLGQVVEPEADLNPPHPLFFDVNNAVRHRDQY